MAEKIISGDSLQNEFVAKFNGMADEVNELKESGGGGSGGAIVELSGESGTLTDEQYAQCILPNTTIKWLNGSGGNMIYEPWRFISPTYYFKSVYIDADECINNTIEIDQISHGWKRKSTAYSGGSQVSVTQTLTSGTKIGAITVDGKTTALYAPEGSSSGGGGGSVPADAIIDVNELPVAVVADEGYLFKNGAKVEEYLLRQVVVHIVDTLPEVGEPLLVGSPAVMNVYYQKVDDKAYSYLTPNVKPGYNSEGWTSLESGLIYINDNSYGGIVTDESQATESDTLYLVYKAKNINTKSIYRTKEVVCYTVYNGIANKLGKPVNIITVDTLPATGEPVLDKPSNYTRIIGYYQKSDNNCYCWATTSLGVPMDMWVTLEQMLGMQGLPYGGIITSLEEVQSEEAVYVLKMELPRLYMYENGWKPKNGITKVFDISIADRITNANETEGDFTLSKLGGFSAKQCTELFGLLRSMYGKIASIQYKTLVSDGGPLGVSVPANLVSWSGIWTLDAYIDPFYKPGNASQYGIALDEFGRVIYDTYDWNLLAVGWFQIVVTIY